MERSNHHEIIIGKGLYYLIQAVIIILAFAVGYFTHWIISAYKDDLTILHEAQDILESNTILEIPEHPRLEYGMIRGMLDTLNDPYTYFNEPATTEIQSDELTGSFGGIGVRIERDLDANWRLYPLPESPSINAGIMDGDILIRVDDFEVTNNTDETSLIALLRGEVGKTVEIVVLRGEVSFTFTIQRQVYNIPSVTTNLLPDAPQIGLVNVDRIAETTAEDIENGLSDLIQKGAQSIILDLRDNTGGLVETGLDIVSLFLTDGEIIHRQFKGEEVKIFLVKKPGPFTEIPMVVLINSYTASSAEMIAGALKNNDRAVLIGTPTYGKTTIQYIFSLQDGYSIHVTSGHWWIPGQEFPLNPDFVLDEDPEGTLILIKAIEILE